jgi:hypothetical protein
MTSLAVFVYRTFNCCLKGQLHEILDPRFFFIIQPHLGPDSRAKAILHMARRVNRFESRQMKSEFSNLFWGKVKNSFVGYCL